MEARSAEFSGAPWLPHGEEIHDPDVAFDMASTLETAEDCVVLRVSVSPWSKAFGRVAGDWLCQRSMPGANVRVPRGGWEGTPGHNGEYLRRMEQIDAWEMCPQGVWMIREMGAAGVGPHAALIAGCASVSLLRSLPGANLPFPVVDAVREAARSRRRDVAEARRATRSASSHLRDVVRGDRVETPEWPAATASFQLARAALVAAEVAAGSAGGWDMSEFWRELASAVESAEELVGGGPSADAMREALGPCELLRARAGLPAGPGRG